MMVKPHFTIKNESQQYKSGRGFLFKDLLTPEILSDVCRRITGKTDYTCTFDDTGYNKGRMALLEYKNAQYFVSFSDTATNGRNSSVQSVTTALMNFHEEENPQKKIFFYFLPSSGNHETDYLLFMYRLMLTVGIEFLNPDVILAQPLSPFISVEDVISARNASRRRNRSNNSSYVTKGNNHVIQIFGKTYGANKYETTLLCIALSRISANKIELYQICEQTLEAIPQRCANVINSLDNVKVFQTDLTMERNYFEKDENLRSPRFIYNLLAKIGSKNCALCGCEIPEIVQGAHIWPVAAIKREAGISLEQKLKYATDGNNGIWLCENHHKMLDEDIITIDMTGDIRCNADTIGANADFVDWSTPTKKLSASIMSKSFKMYLEKRNSI